MTSVTIETRTYIVPKKNSKTPRRSKYGKLYIQPNARAVDSEAAIQSEAFAQCHAAGWKCTKQPVTLVAFFRKTQADLVGVLETVLDAFQGSVYANDKQVVGITADWDYALPPGVTGHFVIRIAYEHV